MLFFTEKACSGDIYKIRIDGSGFFLYKEEMIIVEEL